jgi:hypothetical protein
LGNGLYNTSVATDPTGFVMVYEMCVKDTVCFNVGFLHSVDLINWERIGGQYERDYYTACPSIRYIGGYYYIAYLSHYTDWHIEPRGYYATNISRSKDLIHWEFSTTTAVSPIDGDHGYSDGDFDLVEFQGKTHIVYGNDNQWVGPKTLGSGLREASFDGTIQQFFEKFFQ